ncbi:hypothetical protein GTQ99_16410, partial [Kineococcus sp. T13]|uniref:protein adenylyltransferase SelO family protein n=1 Tax=Kineococcus vitellinus TaxID=2696565 RepID=UPI00196B234A
PAPPRTAPGGAARSERPHLALFEAVLAAQASLVARWVLVGFVHGVMNTDNTTISGETIDYGPCAFLDAYDPSTVYSSIDHGGRYAYGNQPAVAQWNLARLAEALLPLLHEDEEEAVRLATEALGTFPERYRSAWVDGVRAKLGLAGAADRAAPDAVTSLAEELLELMAVHRADFTSSFRALAAAARGDAAAVHRLLPDAGAVDAWLARWRALEPDAAAMDRVNPLYVPRNHLVEEALAAATDGDTAPFERMLDVVSAPFEERPGLERYAAPAPEDFGDYRTFCGT